MGDLTHKAIDGIRAELAAQVERTNDWRARAKQAELETSEQRTRAEGAEAELRELRKLVDAWKAADAGCRGAYGAFMQAVKDTGGKLPSPESFSAARRGLRDAEEALRHG